LENSFTRVRNLCGAYGQLYYGCDWVGGWFTHLPSCIVGNNKDLATMSANSNSVTAVPLMPECLIIIAVHDTFKNMQLFRYDKTVENLLAGEMILIPGICLYHTLLITICMKDTGTGNGVYTLIGQAQLQIRDIGKRTKKSSEITLNFLERISVNNCLFLFSLIDLTLSHSSFSSSFFSF
jgi:hypothetical protein